MCAKSATAKLLSFGSPFSVRGRAKFFSPACKSSNAAINKWRQIRRDASVVHLGGREGGAAEEEASSFPRLAIRVGDFHPDRNQRDTFAKSTNQYILHTVMQASGTI